MIQRFSRLASTLLDWLVPRNCLGCSAEVVGRREWCCDCLPQLTTNTVNRCLERPLLAPWHYSGPMRRAIHRLKYEERSDFAARLVRDGFDDRPSDLGDGACLVPVPLHPNRLVERGYNQSALVARALGRRWQLPILFDLLQRGSHTKAQVGQSREQRLLNVRGAFVVRPPKSSHGAVWLVDDVVTTGATATNCCAALEASGIHFGGTIALARASTSAMPGSYSTNSPQCPAV
jgi:ComF family protein